MPKTNKTLQQRFWEKVNITDSDKCWEWTATKDSNNRYGQINVNGKMKSAHRMCYRFTFGEIPLNLHVLHKCDNSACCNPSHLYLGTHQDNMHDKVKRNRQSFMRGENNGRSKLSKELVLRLRQEYIPYKMSIPKLAKKYNLNVHTVNDVIQFYTWQYI